MSQETSDNKLYVIIVILSIAIVVLAAGRLNNFTPVGTTASSLYITNAPGQKLLSVSGSASAFVVPDTVSLSLGVLTQAPSARETSDKNAVLMNAVLGALKNQGLTDKEIRTSVFSIQPVYSYPKDGGAPTITGYSASNNVVVTTRMVGNLSDILDKSVSAGANQVNGISFMVSQEKQKQIHDELLAGAVKDAREKADKLAENLGVKITGVSSTSISEGGIPQPMALGISEKAAPIQPGQTEVSLSVQVTYIIE
ncbi:MAG: SIMPL domain-containing protein [Candidatus Methanoperedens sp.]|nr:SIMPL domain-containing protein [Candidatus Methanoperedens sp.]MCZ7406075.1 SIMPL domain-containing protein [Candidatus Methanoperedens sp.]